ncbi:MAG: GNAT family N-acetyltransferase [Sphaerochaetaceae bacterium]|nr:GNAT family N-acetyltransferase [Sphaerochaetaceae bacterium]
MIIKSLESQSIEVLHSAFTEGFGDYKLPMQMSLQLFEAMLRRNSFDPGMSFAAFIDDKIAAFILNGRRGSCIYDSGTAALPKFRKQGLTASLAERVKRAMKENSVSSWVLECLEDNTKALALYTKEGFKPTRRFLCWQRSPSSMPDALTAPINASLLEFLQESSDYPPSWQNAIDSAFALGLEARVIKEGKNILGAAIESGGSLLQIAVKRDRRREGLGTRLVGNVSRVINTDEADSSMTAFLKANGFEVFARQIEMCLIDSSRPE